MIVKVTLYYGEFKAYTEQNDHLIPFIWKTNYANQGSEFDVLEWKQRTVFKPFRAQFNALALFEIFEVTVNFQFILFDISLER